MVWPLTSTQASASTTSNAPAATNADPSKYETTIYLHLPGVIGSVTEQGYEGWIKADGFQWGVGLGISSGRWRDDDDEEEEEKDENTYEDRETTNASVSEVTMSKSVGPESPMILFNVLTKKAYDKITIRFVRKSVEPVGLVPVMEYRLYKTLVSGFSTSASDGRRERENMESISFNFGGIEFVMYNEEGKPSEAAHYHLDTYTATLKKGEALDVAEVRKKAKKIKKAKEGEDVTNKGGEEVKEDGDKEVKEDTT